MNNFFLFLGSLYIIVGFIRLYKTHVVLSWLTRYRAVLDDVSLSCSDLPHIIIIIPLLREADIVESTIERFSTIQYPIDLCKIIFVTTEREFEKTQSACNTIEVLKQKLERIADNRMEHIHFPKTIGIKSDQLNYAIRQFEQMNPEFFHKHTYIGVYDADSHTPSNILQYVAKMSQIKNWPDLLQQPTVYLGNRSALSTDKNNLFALAFAWMQTGYAFYVENYNLLKYKKKSGRKLIYAVGHGFFIKWQTLKTINYFPSPIEDTRLGHIFSYLGYSMHLIPVFDVAEVAHKTVIRTVQASVWFIGVTYYMQDLKLARSVDYVGNIRGYNMAIYRIYRNIVWVLNAFIFSAVLLYLCLVYPFFSIIVFLLFLIFPQLYLMVHLQQISSLSTVDLNKKILLSDIIALLVSPIEYVRMSIGPIIGLLKIFVFRIKNEKKLYPKTER